MQKEVSYDSIEAVDQNTDDVVLLNILSYDGRLINLRLLATTTIKDVKYEALIKLNEQITDVLHYKLLKTSDSMLELNECMSISQSNLSDYGK